MLYEIHKFNRIRDIRIDNDLSQKYVGEVLGVTAGNISRQEVGTTEILNTHIIKLAILYKTNIDYLFGLCDNKESYPKLIEETKPKKPITTIRKKLYLSQITVCKNLHIAQNSLSQYENGLRNIPNDTLIQMAILFNTSIDYLLGLTSKDIPHQRNGESYRKLLSRYV